MQNLQILFAQPAEQRIEGSFLPRRRDYNHGRRGHCLAEMALTTMRPEADSLKGTIAPARAYAAKCGKRLRVFDRADFAKAAISGVNLGSEPFNRASALN